MTGGPKLWIFLSVQHPIQTYCKEHGLTQKAFADQVGLSEGFISALIRGRDRCGRNAALKIVGATDGAIDLEELLVWDVPPGTGA